MKTYKFYTGMMLNSGDIEEINIYNQYTLNEVFESYLAWGPTKLELYITVDNEDGTPYLSEMRYIEEDGSTTTAKKDHMKLLQEVFDIPLKP